jgi:hypothetical protein
MRRARACRGLGVEVRRFVDDVGQQAAAGEGEDGEAGERLAERVGPRRERVGEGACQGASERN